MKNDPKSLTVFWGCFIALITTSMAFSTRIGLVYGAWTDTFNLDGVQQGVLFGAGIWPFAISIIVFSLVIDKIGYKAAMFFSFACYALYGLFAFIAHGTEDKAAAYNLLYIGSIILALGNGTVEAFINPVVATLFNKEKTKWLNILHAGWPGGLVLGGLTVAFLGDAAATNWLLLVGAVIIPAIIFLVMLLKAEFPVHERVAAGTTYREMLAEFGAIGALIATYLISAQLEQVFAWWTGMVSWVLIILSVAAYTIYTRSLGRPVMIILTLIMIPLATTELGTDSWVTSLMEAPLLEAGFPSITVLIYTSAIMMILRFNVGPIVKVLTPLGLLACSAALAVVGLYLLSGAGALGSILIAATIYGIGKTFFWPTMLGVVAEQFPKGGALTINAISGIGMLSVGIIGGPLIGYFQESNVTNAVAEANPAVVETITQTKSHAIFGEYKALDNEKLATIPAPDQEALAPVIAESTQAALARIAVFPMIMLIGYIGLILFYKSKGGYKPVAIADH